MTPKPPFIAIQSDAQQLVAQIEAKPGWSMREMVGEAFHNALVDLARPRVGERTRRALKTALSFKGSYDSTGAWITSSAPRRT